MTKVKVLKPFEYKNEKREKDEIVEMPESVAEKVIGQVYGAEPMEKVPVFGEPKEPEEIQEATAGLDVERYAKSGGWVTTDDVSTGDELEIKGPGRMDDRFETGYLVIPVRHKGAELELRLGKRNTRRIADEFGLTPVIGLKGRSKWRQLKTMRDSAQRA